MDLFASWLRGTGPVDLPEILRLDNGKVREALAAD
jgi:hypothetical protein